jgi:hypothetical protein
MEWILLIADIALMPHRVEPLPDAGQIRAMIRQLDDDDFRIRDRATRELRKTGHGALVLLDAAARSGSIEVRERADRLARAIRRESFLPGKSAEGMRATLRSDNGVFRANQPIALQLEIENISQAEFMLPQSIRWGYSMTYGPEKYRVLGLYVPCHAFIEVHQLSGRKGGKEMSPYACGHPGFGDPKPIKAGNSHVYAVPAAMVRNLLPGEYEIRVTFYTSYMSKACKESIKASQMMGQAAEQEINRVKEHALISNTVRFTVE